MKLPDYNKVSTYQTKLHSIIFEIHPRLLFLLHEVEKLKNHLFEFRFKNINKNSSYKNLRCGLEA